MARQTKELELVPAHRNVKITYTPKQGYKFQKFFNQMEDIHETTNPYTFKLTSEELVQWEAIAVDANSGGYTLTINYNANFGTVNDIASAYDKIPAGTVIRKDAPFRYLLNALGNQPGYIIEDVQVDGQSVHYDNSGDFEVQVSKPTVVNVSFKPAVDFSQDVFVASESGTPNKYNKLLFIIPNDRFNGAPRERYEDVSFAVRTSRNSINASGSISNVSDHRAVLEKVNLVNTQDDQDNSYYTLTIDDSYQGAYDFEIARGYYLDYLQVDLNGSNYELNSLHLNKFPVHLDYIRGGVA